MEAGRVGVLNMSNKKANDIERYLRTWHGQIHVAHSKKEPVIIGNRACDSEVLKLLIDDVYATVLKIVDSHG